MARSEAPPGAVRVIAPGTPGAPGSLSLAADATLADRFRRVLGAPRRDASVAPRHEPSPGTADVLVRAEAADLADAAGLLLAPSHLRDGPLLPVPGLLDDERPPSRHGAASEPPDANESAPEAAEAPPPVQPEAAALFAGRHGATPSAWARQGGHEGGGQQREPREARAEAAPAIAAEPEPAWLRDTADFVGSLCAGVDAGFQTWRMTVPLDARQLPDTQLELSLSPHTLCLRFRAAAPESARLVLRYRQHLLDLLGQVPGLPSHIEIELD